MNIRQNLLKTPWPICVVLELCLMSWQFVQKVTINRRVVLVRKFLFRLVFAAKEL